MIGRFAEILGLDRYALAVRNAVAHEDGLGPLWNIRRAFRADRSAHEAELRENFLSRQATRLRTSRSTNNLAR
jgi:hypothetical protein